MSHSSHLQQAKVSHILRGPTLQPKLTIGRPNDKYEQEADRVAEQVMCMPKPGVQRQVEPEEEETLQPKPLVSQITPLAQVQRQEEPEEEEEEPIQAKPLSDQITPLVQRQVEPEEEEEEKEAIQTKLADGMQVQRQVEPEEEEEEPIQTKQVSTHAPPATPNLESRIHALKGEGQPLPESTRAFFEPRFGADFSKVRVHTDKLSARTAQSINARAFTFGRDVVFGAGQYSPGALSSRKLLAHELTHIIQKNGWTGEKGIRSQCTYLVSGRAIAPSIQLAREDEAGYLRKRHGSKRRGVITFIMGKDVRDFYDYAKKYWSKKQRADRVVDKAQSFVEILSHLRNNSNKPLFKKPWGEINIVVHGSARGARMLIRQGGIQYTTARELEAAINENTIRALPDSIIDNKTNINLHGCEIGQSGRLLRLISLAFGGADRKAPSVYAPKVLISYGQASHAAPVSEYLEPKFWVIIPFKNQRKALRSLRWKYRWLPRRQKARIRRRYLTWGSVAYNDRTASAILSSQTIAPVSVRLNEVKLPGKIDLVKHSKIISHFAKNKFKKYYPKKGPQKGVGSVPQSRSFDIVIKKKRLLGNSVRYEVKYIFFLRQKSGRAKWKYPEAKFGFKLLGELPIRGGWKAKLRHWVGSQTYRQYRWTKISQKTKKVWFGTKYSLIAQGTGFRAEVAGLTEKTPSRRSRYFGRYKPPRRP